MRCSEIVWFHVGDRDDVEEPFDTLRLSKSKTRQVTAHGMRGANATIALDRGMSGMLVAETLGHIACHG